MLVAWFLQLHPGHMLLAGRSSQSWRQRFDQLLMQLNLSYLGLRPYSLRRGGATAVFIGGEGFTKICDRGHWFQEKTANMYIKEAVVLPNKTAVPPSLRAHLEALAGAWAFP